MSKLGTLRDEPLLINFIVAIIDLIINDGHFSSATQSDADCRLIRLIRCGRVHTHIASNTNATTIAASGKAISGESTFWTKSRDPRILERRFIYGPPLAWSTAYMPNLVVLAIVVFAP
jgi:hypothetical protein